MFASHAESGGDLVEIEGKLYKQFYGMSSAVAMNKHAGTLLLLLLPYAATTTGGGRGNLS